MVRRKGRPDLGRLGILFAMRLRTATSRGLHSERFRQPGAEGDSTGDSGAAIGARSARAAPPVLSRIGSSRADIQNTVFALQVVEMGAHGRGRIDCDIHTLVLDDVVGNHRARCGRHSKHVDPGGPRSEGVRRISSVPSNGVADDEVVGQVLTGRMGMHGNPGQAVVGKHIVNDYVAEVLSPGNRIEDADSGARSGDLRTVPR